MLVCLPLHARKLLPSFPASPPSSPCTPTRPLTQRDDQWESTGLKTQVPWIAIGLAVALSAFGIMCFVLAWLHVTQRMLGKKQAVGPSSPCACRRQQDAAFPCGDLQGSGGIWEVGSSSLQDSPSSSYYCTAFSTAGVWIHVPGAVDLHPWCVACPRLEGFPRMSPARCAASRSRSAPLNDLFPFPTLACRLLPLLHRAPGMARRARLQL